VIHSPQDLAASRAPHTSMFLRMLVRAAILRRGRALSALFAMVVAAAVATAVLNLYIDVQAKLQREFRNYGANIVIVSRNAARSAAQDAAKDDAIVTASLPVDALSRIDSTLAGRGIAAPFAFVVARTTDGQPVVVAGADFDRVRQLDKWWSVSAWPSAPQQALAGVRALSTVSPKNQPFDLSFHGHTIHLTSAGTVQTGAAEDSRIYLPLADFISWTGVQPSTIEVSANGSPQEVNSRRPSPPPTCARCARSWKAKPACSAKPAPHCLRLPLLSF
jgi:putative ABC transport system permease protein